MDAYTDEPLVAPHLPRDHPVVTKDYSLFTPCINSMVDVIKHWVDDQVDGGTIYGPSRFGKSSGVNNWLQSLLSERHGSYIPMVIWSHSDGGGSGAVAQFYGNLLAAAKHSEALTKNNMLTRLHMLIERMVMLAYQGQGRFVVLVIDEAQGMIQREWLWLVQLHSLLEKERVQLCVISIASVQIYDEPIGMALSGGAHAAARFMLEQAKFDGICSVEELEFVLSGYDEGTEWPEGSGLSFTAGVAPAAWNQGFRMKNYASQIWETMIEALPERYVGPMEFPMKTVAQTGRHILLRLSRNVDPSDITSKESLRKIVDGCAHRQLMALVAAVAPRRLR